MSNADTADFWVACRTLEFAAEDLDAIRSSCQMVGLYPLAEQLEDIARSIRASVEIIRAREVKLGRPQIVRLVAVNSEVV